MIELAIVSWGVGASAVLALIHHLEVDASVEPERQYTATNGLEIFLFWPLLLFLLLWVEVSMALEDRRHR